MATRKGLPIPPTDPQYRYLVSLGRLNVSRGPFIKTVAPGVGDDAGDGYQIGDRWIDTVTDKEYVCLDTTAGAAVWTEVTGGGSGSFIQDTDADTKVQTEEAADEDKVRIDTAGTERVVIDATSFLVKNTHFLAGGLATVGASSGSTLGTSGILTILLEGSRTTGMELINGSGSWPSAASSVAMFSVTAALNAPTDGTGQMRGLLFNPSVSTKDFQSLDAVYVGIAATNAVSIQEVNLFSNGSHFGSTQWSVKQGASFRARQWLSSGAIGGFGRWAGVDINLWDVGGTKAAAMAVANSFGIRMSDCGADVNTSERAFGIQLDLMDGTTNGEQWPIYYGDITQSHPTVLRYDGAAYTDNTTEAATPGGTAFSLLASTSDYIYIGTTSPTQFNRVLLALTTPATAAALTLSWQYWNGAWTALTVNDNTAGFNRRGSIISFTAPSDWATTAVNALTRYWIRVSTSTFSGATPTCRMVMVDEVSAAPLWAVDPAGQHHNFKFQDEALVASNGANNDIAIGGAGFLRITGPTGVFNLTGFAGGAAGRRLIVYNTTVQTMTLTHQATSSAANQITSVTGADEAVAGPCIAEFVYDGSSSKWILISTKT